MKSNLKINQIILLITTVSAFLILIFIFFQIHMDIAEALNIDRAKFEFKDYLMGFGHLFILIFHIYAFTFILIHFRHFKELRLLKSILLVLGIISLFAMGVEKVMVDEIAKEYTYGRSLGEFYILNFAYSINTFFTILLFLFLLRSYKLVLSNNSSNDRIDENIFTIAQYLGIISGIMGLFLTFSLIKKDIIDEQLWIYIPFYILFLIPYILAVIYWLSQKIRFKVEEWYDEKQWQDVFKSSLATLILSIPGLAIFLLISTSSLYFFFLYYLFLILVLFSTGTLYFFKLKDLT